MANEPKADPSLIQAGSRKRVFCSAPSSNSASSGDKHRSRGERRAGSFLGLARARRAPDPRRVGEWRVDRDHPESRKGRRKSSPLYAADDELIPVDPTRIEGPRIPAQGGSNPPAMVLAPRRRAKPRSTPYLKRHTPPSAPFAQGNASPG